MNTPRPPQRANANSVRFRDLRDAAQEVAVTTEAPTPYQISKGADRRRRRWQSDDPSGQHRFARRAYTAEGAVRLMARDIAFYERTGRKSLFQRRRLWWVLTRCRIGWHKWHDSIRSGRRFCLSCGRTP